MEKKIARCRQRRKGKKISITKRINQIRNMIDENGSRTRLSYLHGELRRIFAEAVSAHEELLTLLEIEDTEFEDTWIEDIGIEVDNCGAFVQEYLLSREGEAPSIAGSAFDNESVSAFDVFKSLPESNAQRGLIQGGNGLVGPGNGINVHSREDVQLAHPTSAGLNLQCCSEMGFTTGYEQHGNPFFSHSTTSSTPTSTILNRESSRNILHPQPIGVQPRSSQWTGCRSSANILNPETTAYQPPASQWLSGSANQDYVARHQDSAYYRLDPYAANNVNLNINRITEEQSAFQASQYGRQTASFDQNVEGTIFSNTYSARSLQPGFASAVTSSQNPFSPATGIFNHSTDLLFRENGQGLQNVTWMNSNAPRMTTHTSPDNQHVIGNIDGSKTHDSSVYPCSDITLDLERLQLPKFDGDKYRYQEWKDIFHTCIGSRPGNEKWKMLRLKSCLHGEAKDIIQGLDNSAAAYNTALDRLEVEYGGSRRILARHLNDIKEANQIQSAGNHRELRKFITLLDAVIISLRNNGREEELGDGMLHHVAKTKIPKSLLLQFKRRIAEKNKEDNILNLRDWLLDEVRMQVEVQEDFEGFKSTKKDAMTHFGAQEKSCLICGGIHNIEKCTQLIKMDFAERLKKVRDLRLCFRCLEKGHVSWRCKSSSLCTVDNCQGKHHSLLHRKTIPKQNSEQSKTTNATSCDVGTSLRTIPVIISNGKRRMKIMAVLDDCSTSTYLSEDIANALHLHGELSEMTVSVLGSKKQTFNSMEVQFELSCIDGSYKTNIQANTIKEVMGKMHAVDWQSAKDEWRHLRNIPFPTLPKNCKVKLLIGLDSSAVHQSLKEVIGGPKEPMARLTPLGWTCVGGKFHEKTSLAIKGAHAYYTPRGKWPMGRVLETKVGRDGHIRVVTVKISSKSVTRPISRIIRIQRGTNDHSEKL